MPNRIIKESICSSDSIDQLTWFQEVFFYRLIVNCDDYGRCDARARILNARLFPLKTVSDKDIAKALESLRAAGIVYLYLVDGKPYLQLRTWERHQTIRAKKSKYPSPEHMEACELNAQTSEIICKQMHADVPVIQSESNTNPKEKSSKELQKKTAPRFSAPSVDEVRAYCQERGNIVDPQVFVDFYAGKGWMVGQNHMKDWKACVRTWEKRENENPKRKLVDDRKGITQNMDYDRIMQDMDLQ